MPNHNQQPLLSDGPMTTYSGETVIDISEKDQREKIYFSLKNNGNYYVLEFQLKNADSEYILSYAELEVGRILAVMLCALAPVVCHELCQRRGLGTLLMHQICNLAYTRKINVVIDNPTLEAWPFYKKYFLEHHSYNLGNHQQQITIPIKNVQENSIKFEVGEVTPQVYQLSKLNPKLFENIKKAQIFMSSNQQMIYMSVLRSSN